MYRRGILGYTPVASKWFVSSRKAGEISGCCFSAIAQRDKGNGWRQAIARRMDFNPLSCTFMSALIVAMLVNGRRSMAVKWGRVFCIATNATQTVR